MTLDEATKLLRRIVDWGPPKGGARMLQVPWIELQEATRVVLNACEVAKAVHKIAKHSRDQVFCDGCQAIITAMNKALQ